MIVDKSGNIFEDRRKQDERRKVSIDATGGRREKQRRKDVTKPKKTK